MVIEFNRALFSPISILMNHKSLIFTVVAVACFAGLLGCGPQRAERSDRAIVSGTVIFKGKPVPGGVITFVASDSGNTAGGTLKSDGTYYIEDVPVGENKVTIDPEAIKPELGSRYVQIPAKYLQTGTSSLTFNAQSGENKADFTLE